MTRRKRGRAPRRRCTLSGFLPLPTCPFSREPSRVLCLFRPGDRRRLSAWFPVVRCDREPGHGSVRSSHLRQQEPRCHQCAAFGLQGRRCRHPAAGRREGLAACGAGVVVRQALRAGGGHGRAGRAGGFPGPPVAGVLPLRGRQGCGHGVGRVAGLQRLAGPGGGAGVAVRGRGVPLFVVGFAGGGGVRAGHLPAGRRYAVVRRVADCRGHGGHGGTFGVAA